MVRIGVDTLRCRHCKNEMKHSLSYGEGVNKSEDTKEPSHTERVDQAT